MNQHDLDNAMAGDYVMGLLDGAEHAAAERRLATDPSFAHAVSAWRARLADLDLTAEETPPSPALWQRIADATKLAPIDAPLEWAVTSNGVFYAALIAVRPDGSFDDGDIRAQTTLTLENMKHCLEAAGGTMDDVAQVTVYLTARKDAKIMNEVYATYFNKPYPNRATVVISELLVPGCIIEMVVYAHIGAK